jgi:retron-type reverse transcriptase
MNYEKVQELQKKLYEKAKSEPKYRFYALYDKIYRRDVLSLAYQKIKENKGVAGIDGISIEEIEVKGKEEFLEEIGKQLKEGTYQAKPVRRVYIPKKDGKKRPLGIYHLLRIE